MIEQFKDKWETLTPKGKQIAVLLTIIIGFVFIMWVTGGKDSGPRANASGPLEITNILTDSDPRALGIEALSSQVRRVNEKTESMETDLVEFKNSIKVEQKRAASSLSKEFEDTSQEVSNIKEKLTELDDLKTQIRELRYQLSKQKEETTKLASSAKVTNSAGGAQQDAPTHSGVGGHHDSRPVGSPGTTVTDQTINSQRQEVVDLYNTVPAQEESFTRSALGTNESGDGLEGGEIRMISAATNPLPETGVPEEEEKEGLKIALPAGSILSGVLINGMDAPTRAGKADPYPSLIRVKHEAVLPNYHRADIRECMLIGATHASLSDERAYTRLESITCVFNDESVIEQSIDGYAVGEDGKLGMRGRLVSKNGVVLARALTAGFLEGISGAFSGARVPVVGTTVTQEQQIQSLLSSDSFQAAGLEGAGSAMERLADYYIQLAEGIYPVIEIDAGRQIEFVITRGTTLSEKE